MLLTFSVFDLLRTPPRDTFLRLNKPGSLRRRINIILKVVDAAVVAFGGAAFVVRLDLITTAHFSDSFILDGEIVELAICDGDITLLYLQNTFILHNEFPLLVIVRL